MLAPDGASPFDADIEEEEEGNFEELQSALAAVFCEVTMGTGTRLSQLLGMQAL